MFSRELCTALRGAGLTGFLGQVSRECTDGWSNGAENPRRQRIVLPVSVTPSLVL